MSAGLLRRAARSLAGAIWLGGALAACSREQGPSQIQIEEARARVYPNQAGAIYLRVINAGSGGDALEGASAPWARSIALHEVVRNGDVVGMREVSAGVSIAPHATLVLRPGGRHLMLQGARLPAGERRAPLSLRFARAGTLDTSVSIEALEAREIP